MADQKSLDEQLAEPEATPAPAVTPGAADTKSAAPGKQGILSLTIKDKGALYSAYMPFIKGGGLFIPTNKAYKLGDEVFMLLKLMEEAERLPVVGKVIWKTPPGAQNNRIAGIGIQFNSDPDGEKVRNAIEGQLAGMLKSDRLTHTM